MKAIFGLFLLGVLIMLCIKIFASVFMLILALCAIAWPVLVVIFWIVVAVALCRWVWSTITE